MDCGKVKEEKTSMIQEHPSIIFINVRMENI